MAAIRKRTGKSGDSYLIISSNGKDMFGRQVRNSTTWRPSPDMTAAQIKRAVKIAAADFDRQCEQGFKVDDNQTFAEYAEYVLSLKEANGTKKGTLRSSRQMLGRINASLGNLKLKEIRPQHLNLFYTDLSKKGQRISGHYAYVLDAEKFKETIRKKFGSFDKYHENGGPGCSTLAKMCRGEHCDYDLAMRSAKLLGAKFNSLFREEKQTEPLSANTIHHYHNMISMILAQAEREMIIPYNSATKASPPKVIRKEPNFMQVDDVMRIMECLQKEPLMWQAVMMLLIATGARRGEIAGLKWKNVDFENGNIRIDCALLYGSKTGVYEETPKTNAGYRTIGIPGEVMDLLRRYRVEQNKQKLRTGSDWEQTDYVFTNETGRYIHPCTFSSWPSDFAKRYGLSHINPHALRHTQASVLYQNNVDPVTISRRLGHSRVSTTQDIYCHLLEQADDMARDAIGEVLFGEKKKQPPTPGKQSAR